jgi:N4-(beta-N-acetylglucosaminyl)-L-asparaginase
MTKNHVDRRRFLQASAVAGGLAGGMISASRTATAMTPKISRVTKADVRPVVISSANGNTHKNGGDETCVERAFRMITEGKDVLDAVIAGVNIVELDPDDTSVGYGGLPDADGNVTLDSCCMHGPLKRAGGVAAIQGVRTPSLVAREVADSTDHHLLVGQGAQDFARGMGFKIEDDLNTERSRKIWREWKRRTDPEHYLDPARRSEVGHKIGLQMVAEGKIDPQHYYGTINCNAINAEGDICGVTTTSGLAFKIPGRVGDSPILGAGLWVDNDFGAAGSTGRGEANLYNLASFLIVEQLRLGKAPKDAGIEALKRIQAATIEKRLLNSKGQPNFDVTFYVLNKQGQYAGVALYGSDKTKFAVCDENGPRLEIVEGLLEGRSRD